MVKKQPAKKIKETDLYRPIYDYLTEQGYTVRSEVKDCDIAAVKGEELVVIEMKTSFNATLLIQATQRQKAADSVYVAIPRPKGGAFSKGWNEMCHLLKRLELGLIVVNFKGDAAAAEIIFHPDTLKLTKNKKKRHTIIREIAGRHNDYNTGGSNKTKLMTAYKENAVQIACCFERFGPLSPKQLRKLGTGPKTYSILSKNFYGWFEKTGPGLYNLHPEGKKCLQECQELYEYYLKGLEDKKLD